MTFEDWFEENFPLGYTKDGYKDIHGLGMKEYLKQAWESGYDVGHYDGYGDGADNTLPGMTDYTYEQFSKDCDRYDR